MSLTLTLMIVSVLAIPSQTIGQHETIVWERVLDGRIESVAWNSLGTHIAYVTSTPDSGNVNLLEVETLVVTSFQLLGADRSARPVWSPDSQTLVVFTAGKLYILDTDTHNLTTMDVGITGNMSWGPNSPQIYIYTLDNPINAEVYIYNIKEDTLTPYLEIRSRGVNNIFDLSPDGTILALPNDQTHSVGFWNSQAELIEELSHDAFEQSNSACAPSESDYTTIDTIKWNIDSTALAVGSYSGLDLCVLEEDSLAVRHLDSTPTYAVSWSPDGKYIASGTFQWADMGVGCEIRLFDVLNGYQRSVAEIAQNVCNVFSISWSPDSQRIAVATNHGLWIGDVHVELPE